MTTEKSEKAKPRARRELFSARAEYACVAMLELAARYGDAQPVRLRSIAEAHDISPRFLVQILLQLKGAGLVRSTRGAAGGYLLSRPPEQISLATILGVIDRSDREPTRTTEMGSAPSALAQTIRCVWREIQARQQRVLEETTLAELVRRSQENYALSYQI